MALIDCRFCSCYQRPLLLRIFLLIFIGLALWGWIILLVRALILLLKNCLRCCRCLLRNLPCSSRWLLILLLFLLLLPVFEKFLLQGLYTLLERTVLLPVLRLDNVIVTHDHSPIEFFQCQLAEQIVSAFFEVHDNFRRLEVATLVILRYSRQLLQLRVEWLDFVTSRLTRMISRLVDFYVGSAQVGASITISPTTRRQCIYLRLL